MAVSNGTPSTFGKILATSGNRRGNQTRDRWISRPPLKLMRYRNRDTVIVGSECVCVVCGGGGGGVFVYFERVWQE